jgi:hypothetical protein
MATCRGSPFHAGSGQTIGGNLFALRDLFQGSLYLEVADGVVHTMHGFGGRDIRIERMRRPHALLQQLSA